MLQRAESPTVLAGVEASRSFFSSCFGGPGDRGWWVAHVDEAVRCIHVARYEDWDRGCDGEGGLPVRSILRDAVQLDSVGLLLAHRSDGSTSLRGLPAEETRDLARAAEAVDVTLLDRLEFSGEDCTSFRRLGLI
jgi:hypothetical protein